jgi:lysozyme
MGLFDPAAHALGLFQFCVQVSMRPGSFLLSLAVCVALTGCTSSSGIDEILARPSMEVTSSIAKPDKTTPQEIVALAEEEEGVAALAETAPAPSSAPSVQALAMIEPNKPASGLKASLTRPGPRIKVERHRFRDAKPINFGKAKPQDLPVHGVDVSRWQANIDWAKLKSQGANFVFIKATDGGDHLDPMFMKNWVNAHEAGLKRGAYHFFYWCRTAGEQADWFIRNVPKVEGALPPVIDVEYNHLSNCKRRLPRAKVIEKMQVFMDKLEAHYGQRPIIYTAPDFYADNLKGEFLDYPFWLRSVAAHPSKRYPGRKWVFWQYSGSGLSQGVKGNIDLNVFHGTEKQWRDWVNGVSYTARAN